jgi:hypothetical protein
VLELLVWTMDAFWSYEAGFVILLGNDCRSELQVKIAETTRSETTLVMLFDVIKLYSVNISTLYAIAEK